MSNPLDFMKGAEAQEPEEKKEPVIEQVQEEKPKKGKAKAVKVVEPEPEEDETEDDEPAAELNPFELAEYDEYRVSHTNKARLNPDTLDKEWYPVFEKEKFLRKTTIQHSHAEILNGQSHNSNLRYYLSK